MTEKCPNCKSDLIYEPSAGRVTFDFKGTANSCVGLREWYCPNKDFNLTTMQRDFKTALKEHQKWEAAKVLNVTIN